jgi:hypothetical protein
VSQYLQYGSSIIASDSLAVGRVPVGARYQGQTLLDAWQAFRADYSIVYGRGRGPREYSVTVQRFFSSEAAALQFFLTHEDTLPLQGDLTYVDSVAASALTMADAVCSVRMGQLVGTCVFCDYNFTGARFESDDVPSAPTDTDTVKAINEVLTASITSKAIAFDVPFAAAPRGIGLTISAPDAGATVEFQIRESSRTASGFTVDFAAAIPASGYKLTGFALL